MKVKLLYKKDLEACFLIEGPFYLVNSLRRVILEDLPTLRIEDVYIRKNFSALYDEWLAMRLGQLIIKAKDPNLEKVEFELKEVGKKWVYAKDLKPKKEYEGKVEILYGDTPIVYLEEDQEIDLDCVAVWGSGKDHSKFKPAHVWFKYYPEIKIKQENVDEKVAKEIVEACPRNILEYKDGKLIVREDRILDCNLCKACEDVCDGKIVEVKGNPNKILFYIESFGDYDPIDIMKKSIELLIKRFENFKEKVREVLSQVEVKE